MSDDLTALDAALRAEADGLLDRGLRAAIQRYGVLHITGSYALQLMTWRDLDLYLQATDLPVERFFELGSSIATCLGAPKMEFRNRRIDVEPDQPAGLYWGIYLGNERAGAWKIDLWALEPGECRRRIEGCEAIARRLTPASRASILAIKSRCWQDPQYRRAYSSADVYTAVLDEGIREIEGFRGYLARKGIRIVA